MQLVLNPLCRINCIMALATNGLIVYPATLLRVLYVSRSTPAGKIGYGGVVAVLARARTWQECKPSARAAASAAAAALGLAQPQM